MKISGLTITIDNGSRIRIDQTKPELAIYSPHGGSYGETEIEGVVEFCKLPLIEIVNIVGQLAKEELAELEKARESARQENPESGRFSNIEFDMQEEEPQDKGQDKTQEKKNVLQFPTPSDARFSLLEID